MNKSLLLSLSLLLLAGTDLCAIGGRGGDFRGESRPSPDRDKNMEHNRSPTMSRSLPHDYGRDRYDHNDRSNRGFNPEEQAIARPKTGELPAAISNKNFTPKDQTINPAAKNATGNAAQKNPHNNYNNHHDWFNKNYWDAHPNKWYHNPDNTDWWQPAAWGAVAGWLPWGWENPAPYDYGYGGNVVYQNDSVLLNGSPIATEQEYLQQARQIADTDPTGNPETMEWMPLGVYALTDAHNYAGTQANMFLQLAVNKQGFLAGTYINTTLQSDRPIQGMIDQKSQRAVWKAADKSGTGLLMETGANNLTLDHTTALIHFPDGSTQTWTMIRVPPPPVPL